MGTSPGALGQFSRRRFLLGGSAAALLAASGCGDDDSGSAAPGAPGASSTTGASASFPVTVEHRYGSTTVSGAPERVVALGLTDVDPILALGVVPVGFIDWHGDYDKADIRNSLWPWAHDLVGDAEPTDAPQRRQFNFEAIAARPRSRPSSPATTCSPSSVSSSWSCSTRPTC